MPSNTAAVQARELPWQAMHYMRKTVNFNDTGIATGLPFAQYLPAGAQIHYCMVNVVTAFNAGTTNVLTVGTNSSSFNNIVAAGDVDESVAEGQMVMAGADLEFASAAQPYVKFTESGTAATTGQAIVTIVFTVDNDE